MARILKRDAAKRELIAQRVWYAENSSIELADRFLEAANSTLDILSTQPNGGNPFLVDTPGFRGMRRFRMSDGFEKVLHSCFPLQDGIDLVRVVHGSRDLARLLAEGYFSWISFTSYRA